VPSELALGADEESENEGDQDAKGEFELAVEVRLCQPRPGRPPGLS